MILELLKGDCLVEMKALESNSIDALITDPPAGIAFMNKEWDKDKGGRNQWIAWFEEIMEECYRVLKPGAHGLVWALPRTSHWTATALENAGFEVRDVVNHIFGSGFPKSLDVSKAIDKAAGAKREVIGVDPQAARRNKTVSKFASTYGEIKDTDSCPVTAPATPEAKQWEGFGTALKPSVEIWLLVAKPFTTVPLDAIIDKINSDLRELLCHQLPAKYVQQISTSNLRESSGQQFGFAQWTVDVFHIIESLETEPKTDTSISQDVVLIFSNIAMSWKAILDVLLLNRNTFTTKTESNLITELKTLRYSILQTMQKNITQELMKQNAEMFIASTVLASLVSALLRLKGLMEIFALEHVSTQAESLENPRENQQILGLEIVEAALKNQHEHWVLIRKPLGEKTVAANVLKHGTGALNIDASRIEIEDAKRPSNNTEDICLKNQKVLCADSVKKKIGQEKAESPIDFVTDDAMDLAEKEDSIIPSDSQIKSVTCDLNTGAMKKENIDTFLNTDMSGKTSTEEKFQMDLSCTTLMKLSMTTDQKILSSCQEGSTSECIQGSLINTPMEEVQHCIVEDGKKKQDTTGRWPSNLILSEDAAKELDEHSGKLTSGKPGKRTKDWSGYATGLKTLDQESGFGDSGGASRFFMIIHKECGQEKIAVGDINVGKKMESNGECLSIAGCGSRNSAQFLMDITSITRTETHSIMTCRILNALTDMPIGICTIESEKIICPSMESSIGGVSLVKNTEAWIFFTNEQLAPIVGIAKFAPMKNFVNGENPTANITTDITENIEPKTDRFFYVAKASKSDKGAENSHPTVKSTKLMEYLIKLICPPGGTILDPFMGSGSTGVAAIRNGFKFIGIEQSDEYFAIAEKRLMEGA